MTVDCELRLIVGVIAESEHGLRRLTVQVQPIAPDDVRYL
jgi:hypothetical protein